MSISVTLFHRFKVVVDLIFSKSYTTESSAYPLESFDPAQSFVQTD